MNNERRKTLKWIIESIKSKQMPHDKISTEIELVAADEQAAFDNLPEGLQASMMGCSMEEAVDELSDAATALQHAKTDEDIEEVIQQIEQVIGY